MALKDTRGFMAKKLTPEKNPPEKIDLIIEGQQWESPRITPPRFTWRHGLILALILGGGILFAFGFLIIAGLVLIAVLMMNIFLFVIKKLT